MFAIIRRRVMRITLAPTSKVKVTLRGQMLIQSVIGYLSCLVCNFLCPRHEMEGAYSVTPVRVCLCVLVLRCQRLVGSII